MKILVLGYIVRGPLGGLAWHHFQYILGLKKLGHEVLFLEDSHDYPSCYNPETFETNSDPTYGLHFIKNLFDAYNLPEHWSYFDSFTNSWFGLSKQKTMSFCKEADAVLNISGFNPVRSWWSNIKHRVLIDTDPGFTQIRHLTDPLAKSFALAHNYFFSFAENINKSFCTIPNDGFLWQATRQPVFLNAWLPSSCNYRGKWTTVMQWKSYKSLQFEGHNYGMKSLSFKGFYKLPQLLPLEIFEMAIGGDTAPVDELKGCGWHIISSQVPTKTPWAYQEYIAASKGEWTVAKQGYVTTQSGWFSERSLCYLASGKPVVTEDTGLTHIFKTGQGILLFNSIDEAIESINKINADYNFHCKQARNFVEENFESGKVLNNLLASVFGI